jgi:hypothetical protein
VKSFDSFRNMLPEKDEHKRSSEYKRLSPKMKDAVDYIFSELESKPSDFLNSFENTIKTSAKKFKVSEKELLNYFEREVLSI